MNRSWLGVRRGRWRSPDAAAIDASGGDADPVDGALDAHTCVAARTSPTGTFETPSLVNGVNTAEIESRLVSPATGARGSDVWANEWAR